MPWRIPGSATLPTPPGTGGEVLTWARAFSGAVADLYRVIAEQLGLLGSAAGGSPNLDGGVPDSNYGAVSPLDGGIP